jgi:predicted amidophosphoribosyltransferase
MPMSFLDVEVHCHKCGMKIPLYGEICPYCHSPKSSFQKGCAGLYAMLLLIFFIIFLLIMLFR